MTPALAPWIQRTAPATFEDQLTHALPNQSVRISCIDYREGDIVGYHLTSAGARVHSSMIEDLHLILPGKMFLVIQGHSDCAKTKSMNPRHDGETDREYLARIDQTTIRNLWDGAEILLRDPVIGKAVQDGVKFCVAFHDVHSGETTFYERETKDLIAHLQEFSSTQMSFSRAAA